MFLKCLECGHIFEEGEQHIIREYHNEISGSFYEDFASCPVCGGDFEEAKCCKSCDGAFLADELIAGYCKKCLYASLNVESFLDFATTGVQSDTDIDTLEDFVFLKVFGLPKSPDVSTSSLKAWCRTIYEKTDKNVLMRAIGAYMDTLPSLWDDFAEYLHDKEVRK